MKALIHILFPVVLFFGLNQSANSQIRIDTTSFSNFNWITKQNQIVKKYTITNNSIEDYLTWVDTDPVDGRDDKLIIHLYFFKHLVDFSFGALMYEFAETDPSCIGATFLKNISAGESFTYFIIKTDSKSTFYEDRIFITTRYRVEQHLKTHINGVHLYKPSDIFLFESCSNQESTCTPSEDKETEHKATDNQK